jgi:hypothetical protein
MAQPFRSRKPLSIWRLGRSLFRIPIEQATFAYRGFHVDEGPAARRRLESIGCTFLTGYHAALDEPEAEQLIERLQSIDEELRGFAFEGAAMGLALLDLLTPWRKDRWQSFMDAGAVVHQYMAHVGVGWAMARLQRWRKHHPSLRDPLLRWLAIDGYGFHEGYFYWRRFIKSQALPERLNGYARRVFDQGLGRSLWFVEGANVQRISETVASFTPARRADLWSGVGLACTYAGGADQREVEALRKAAASHETQLAQGAAFAAKTRQKACNPTSNTEMVCRVLCGMPADSAAEITDLALHNLPADDEVPAYEVWRRRIQNYFC